MARHSSPRPTRSDSAPRAGGFGEFVSALGALAGPGLGGPALAGAGGPALPRGGAFPGGPSAGPHVPARPLPAAPRPDPAADGRSASFVGAPGRDPAAPAALPGRTPSSLRPAPPGSGSLDREPHDREPHGRRDPRVSDDLTRRSTRPDDLTRRCARPGRPGEVRPLTGRLAVAAVAAGALATAGHSAVTGLDAPTGETRADLALSAASSGDAAASSGTSDRAGALDAATTGVMALTTSAAATPPADAGQVTSLSKARQKADTAAREAAEREAAARAPKFVKPAQGTFTSGFGARWGTSHKGIDIANAIGTPIVSVADGTVLESGPASGFGMWVRVQLDDGTINVYGHINKSFVKEGQKVRAGQEIAEIGNRGQSTGPHLHFEVWTAGGTKINPLPWLAERGISLGAQED